MNDGQQFELFDLSGQPVARLRHEALGRLVFQLRYDQLVLSSMALLMGLTVVFAFGVERGKGLGRRETASTAFVRQSSANPPASALPSSEEPGPERAARPMPSTPTNPVEPQTAPPAAPQAKPKSRVASATAASTTTKASASTTRREAPKAQAGKGNGRYAIQVVTFTRAQAAKRELDRLIARGERAFLVMRKDRTVVYVGPFPSQTRASEKLTMLKTRYQDCFLKIL